jgi:glutaredoxin 3
MNSKKLWPCILLASLCFTTLYASETCCKSPQEKTEEKPVLCLYYSPGCPHSQDILNYLQRVHKTVPMQNVIDNPEAKLALKKAGGKLQVPCLVIDGKPLYESGDILSWLMHHLDLLEPSK